MHVLVCVLKDSVCLYLDIPLTLKYIAIPFGENTLKQSLYIGATVSYKGVLYPSLEPEEQRVLVVGNDDADDLILKSSSPALN